MPARVDQQGPDIMCEVFILAPTDFVDEHEILTSGPLPNVVDVPAAEPVDAPPTA